MEGKIPNFLYRGYGNYVIQKNNKQWTWVDQKDQSVVASLGEPKGGYPFGRQIWNIHKPMCYSEHNKRNLLLTSCESDEFSCDDATCVAGDKRCNHFFDCRDKSDEKDCKMIKFAKDYKVCKLC